MAAHTSFGEFAGGTDPTTITLGWEPKLVLLWGTFQGSYGSFSAINYFVMGIAKGTATNEANQFTECMSADWNGSAFFGPTARRNRRAGEIISDVNSGGISVNFAHISSLSSTGFTVDYTLGNGSGYRYQYLALGGSSVTVAIGSLTAPTSVGSQSVTGLGLTPDWYMLTSGSDGDSANGLHYTIGHCDGTRQGVSGWHQFGSVAGNAGTTNDVTSYQRTTKVCAILDDDDGSVIGEAEHVAVASGSFTINWTTAPAAGQTIKYVAVSFGGELRAHVGSLTAPLVTGSVLTSGLTVTPDVVMFQSCGLAASTSIQNDLRFTIGWGSPSSNLALWQGDNDGITAIANRRNVKYAADTRCLIHAHPTGVGTGALDAEAAITSVGLGSFALAWATVDGVARETIFVAFGAAFTPPSSDGYVVTIAGTSRDPLLETFNIQAPINGIATMRADFDSQNAPIFMPGLDDEIIVYEFGAPLFGGYITALRLRGLGGPNDEAVVVEVTAADYKVAATRRVVNEIISDPAGLVLKDILLVLEAYLTPYGISLDPAQVDGPAVDPVVYVDRRLKEILDELSGLTGYVWDIDVYKVLRMYAIGTYAATFSVLEAALPALYFGDITVEPTREQYANRILLRFGPDGDATTTDTFFGDGIEDTFTLSAPLTNYAAGVYVALGYVTAQATVSPPVNETLSMVGEGGNWEFDPVTNTITRTLGAPTNGDVIQITYIGRFPVTVTVEDATDISLNGLFELIVPKADTMSLTVATALANAELLKHLTVLKRVTYSTFERGLSAGMTQTITVPKRDNLDVTAVVTEVVIESEPGSDLLVRRVTALEGDVVQGDWRDIYRQFLA